MAEGGKGALRELVAYLGFDLDERKLDKADRRIEKTKSIAQTLSGVLGAVGIAFAGRELEQFITSQVALGNTLGDTAHILGVSTDELQMWQYAAATSGIAADDASKAMQYLSRSTGAARAGQLIYSRVFSDFGVKLTDTAGKARPLTEILGDLAEGLAKSGDTGKKTYAAMTLLGNTGMQMIPVLNMGGEGVRKLFGEFKQLGGGITSDFIEHAQEAMHATAKWHLASLELSTEVSGALIPAVSDLASGVAMGIARFREWTKGTHVMRNALITLGIVAAAAVVTWAILNLEILLVVAALALLAIAVDDVITFFEGGDSVLGRFLDRIYGVGASKEIAKELRDAWKEVSQAFSELWDAVKSLGPDLKDLFLTFTSKKAGVDSAKSGIQAMADTMRSLVLEIKGAVEWFDRMVKKFDDFAKAHPLIVHAAQRSLHEVGQGHVGIGGVIKALSGDINEAATGDTGDVDWYNRTVRHSKTALPVNDVSRYDIARAPAMVNQRNETHVTIHGVPDAAAASSKLTLAVKDGHVEANNAAFAAVGGGGPP